MPFLAATALAALFTSGCAGPEQKLGRGVNNMFEVVRMGETTLWGWRPDACVYHEEATWHLATAPTPDRTTSPTL